MEEFNYYQLVTLDGKETPRFFYRQSSARDEVWSPTEKEWVPTRTLTWMLINKEATLERIDRDPVADIRDNV
ncbi:MAG: hypothetical protein ACYCPK_01340 [Acidimicrobiales bacterium]